MGLTDCDFISQWPGYEHVDWMRSINLNTPTGWMTKGQLAFQIGKMISNYVEVSSPSR